MKNVLEFDNYVEFLRETVYSPTSRRGYQVQIAKAIGCQAAYLSQILKSKAELSEDQAFKLTRFLKLSPIETEYLMVLVRLSAASTPELRGYLEAQKSRLKSESEEIKGRMISEKNALDDTDLFKYFSSWLPSTIHMATSSANYQQVGALAKRLRLSEDKVQETLLFLESLNLVDFTTERWNYRGGTIHYPKESAINTAHQVVRRQQVTRSIEENDKDNIHFSSIFTISPETFKKLKLDLLDYIGRSHTEIHQSGADEIYSMCFDLFKVV